MHRWHVGGFCRPEIGQAVLLHAEAQQAAKGKEAASQRPVSTGDEPEQDEEDDLLPPEVLDAVIKQSRCALFSAFLV